MPKPSPVPSLPASDDNELCHELSEACVEGLVLVVLADGSLRNHPLVDKNTPRIGKGPFAQVACPPGRDRSAWLLGRASRALEKKHGPRGVGFEILHEGGARTGCRPLVDRFRAAMAAMAKARDGAA